MRTVAKSHMGDLMRDDARDLSLVPGVLENAAVDVDEAPGKGEGVDVARVHDLEVVLKFRAAGIGSKPLPDGVYVTAHRRVVQDRYLLLGLRRRLLPDLNVVLRLEKIETRLDVGLRLSERRRKETCRHDERRSSRRNSESMHLSSSCQL